MAQEHAPACGSHGAQKSTRFYAVSHHLVVATVQALHTLNADTAAPMAFNFGAHLDEHLCKIRNFGLLRRVFENGFTLGQGRSHEEVFGARDRDHIGGDACTLQARATLGQLGDHVAVLDHDLGTHGLQSLDMLIHRARPDSAAPRQRHRGLAKARQQRPQRQH